MFKLKIRLHKNFKLVTVNKLNLNILYVNARSIRNKVEDLEDLIKAQKFDVHIIMITESWLYPDEKINLKGYKAEYSSRPTRAGGVIILVKNNLSPIHTIYSSAIDDNNFLVVEVPAAKCNLCCIYRKPSSDMKGFLAEFDRVLARFKNCIIMGDFNLNINNVECNDVESYLNLTEANGYSILNKTLPTRISNTVSTNIDHFLTDFSCLGKQFNYQFATDDWHLSDHKIILVSIEKANTVSCNHNINKRKRLVYSNELADDVKSIRDDNFENFIHDTKALIEKHSKVVNPAKFNIHKQYITKEILELIKKRNYFFKNFKKKQDTQLFNLYTYYRKKVNSLKQKSKRKFLNNEFSKVAGNSKKTWQVLNHTILGKDQSEKLQNIILEKNNTIMDDQVKVANELNAHFATTAQRITDTIDSPTTKEIPNRDFQILTPCPDPVTNVNEVKRIIEELKNGKAVGIDGISAEFLKKYKEEYSIKIAKLVNDSFESGIFPDILKKSLVTPIFKSGNPKDKNNYRPISVVSVVAKVFEKVIQRVLMEHINENNIIHPNQFGFTSQSNTQTAVNHLMHRIISNMDAGWKYILCVFIDISKAFECVDHKILIERLRYYKFNEKFIKLIESYLAGRVQSVKLNGVVSEEAPVTSSVPQGGSVSSSFFNIYINLIFLLILYGYTQFFADDEVILYAENDLEELERKVNSDLRKIQNFMSSNKLKINETKTVYMMFGNNDNLNINIGNTKIERVQEYKYLGMILDENLNYKSHISAIKKKITPMIYLIARSRKFISLQTGWLLYFAHIYSHLSYMNMVWSNANCFDINQLQTLQNKCVKIITTKHPLTSTTTLYDEDHLPVSALNDYQSLINVFKIKHNMIKNNINMDQGHNKHSHSTRRKSDFYLQKPNTRKMETDFYFKAFKLFNELSTEIKKTTTLSSFKTKIRKIIIQNWIINYH